MNQRSELNELLTRQATKGQMKSFFSCFWEDVGFWLAYIGTPFSTTDINFMPDVMAANGTSDTLLIDKPVIKMPTVEHWQPRLKSYRNQGLSDCSHTNA
jgi:hypothetical protein